MTDAPDFRLYHSNGLDLLAKLLANTLRAPVAGRQDQVAITITTVVHVNNLLGHLYMLPVAPMHRRIAPAVLAGLGDAQPAKQ